MDFTVGQIVWARCNKNNIYWPGKITMISNNTNNLWLSELFDNIQQQCNYHIEFFTTNESIWTTDILCYGQYRDSMTNESFIHYGLHPTIKENFLNAVNQADCACNHEIYMNSNHLTSMSAMTSQQQNSLPTSEDNTDNNFLLISSPMFASNPGNYNPSYQQISTPSLNCPIQSFDTFTTNNSTTNEMLTTNNDWYKEQGLLVESITPPLCSENDHQLEYISSSDNFQKQNSVIIITLKTYSNSSFISYLFNCLSNIFHSSIIYIDDLINYQHPNTYNIYYLICFDYFDSIIKQTLNLTILNNLNAHINYLFLIINTPSYELIKHFYSIIIDKRTIMILHYHSTFDNESLLLCSGNRTIFEMIRSTFLKYLCSKIKYIESNDNEQEQFDLSNTMSFVPQSNNIKNISMIDISNQKLPSNALIDYENITNESLFVSSMTKRAKKLNRQRVFNNFRKKLFNSKFKQHLSENEIISNSSSEYCVQNILENINMSK